MKSVQSKNSNVLQKTDDVSSALLTFADGTTASLYANRIAKDSLRQFILYSDNEVFTLDLIKKTIHQANFIINNNLVRSTTQQVDTRDEDALENEIKAFINNIITGKGHTCSTNAKDGVEALRIAKLIDSQSIKKE